MQMGGEGFQFAFPQFSLLHMKPFFVTVKSTSQFGEQKFAPQPNPGKAWGAFSPLTLQVLLAQTT